MTNSDYMTPTKQLLEKTKILSIHQEMAQLIPCKVYTFNKNRLLAYHYNYDILFADGRSVNNFTANRIEIKSSLARTNFLCSSSEMKFFSSAFLGKVNEVNAGSL